MLPGVLAEREHLADVALGLRVALEAVLVAALLLADLAVPPQALQALALHLVRDIFGRADFTAGVNTISTQARPVILVSHTLWA